jgi:hypothetical protein
MEILNYCIRNAGQRICKDQEAKTNRVNTIQARNAQVDFFKKRRLHPPSQT